MQQRYARAATNAVIPHSGLSDETLGRLRRQRGYSRLKQLPATRADAMLLTRSGFPVGCAGDLVISGVRRPDSKLSALFLIFQIGEAAHNAQSSDHRRRRRRGSARLWPWCAAEPKSNCLRPSQHSAAIALERRYRSAKIGPSASMQGSATLTKPRSPRSPRWCGNSASNIFRSARMLPL